MRDDAGSGDPLARFAADKARAVRRLAADSRLAEDARALTEQLFSARYMYGFESLGRPIIQFPADMVAVQEIVWATKPDVIIETGIAHGGSLAQSAQALATLDLADAVSRGAPMDPRASRRKVVGVDVDIRPHNRALIEAHPLRGYLRLHEGSSIDPATVAAVRREIAPGARVMALLDSHHTRDHVLAELEAYAPLVSPGCFCVAFDTVVEDMPPGFFPDRPWGPGDGPRAAVDAFLAGAGAALGFARDPEYNAKLVLSGCRGGYLRRAEADRDAIAAA